MCQLAAKREHRLKQLAKLLSRILAPHGSKPVRCSLGVCSASLAAAMVFAGSSEDVVVCTDHTAMEQPRLQTQLLQSLGNRAGMKVETRAKGFH